MRQKESNQGEGVIAIAKARVARELRAFDGFVRRNAHGVGAMLESGHEQPVPIFQQLARSDPFGRNDVCAVPAVAAQR